MFGLNGYGKVRGIIPAMPTFFTKRGGLSYSDLRSAINFAVECGVSGLAVLVIGGEFYKLNENERKRVASAAIGTAHRRLPVFIGVSHSGLKPAVDLARHAVNNGASGVILSPPYFYPMRKEIEETTVRFIREFCDLCSCPVILQLFYTENAMPLGVAELKDVLAESQNIAAIKIEGNNATRIIRQLHRNFASKVSILGGKLGINFAEKLNNGASGTIPGLSFSDIFVRAFDAFRSERNGGVKILSNLEPYFKFINGHFDQFVAIEKELLLFRGVVANSGLRLPCIPLTDRQLTELKHRVFPACYGRL